MRDHAVPFHFSEAKASVTTSTFSRLSRQNLRWSSTSGVDFVLHHVLKSLVISRPKEDHNFHLFACEPVIHDLVSSELVAKSVQLGRNPFNSVPIATLSACNSLERRSIAFSTSQSSHFGVQTFNKVTNSHTRRNTMRINYQVWNDTFLGKGHVFVSISHSNSAFLTVSRCKLVAYLGNSD